MEIPKEICVFHWNQSGELTEIYLNRFAAFWSDSLNIHLLFLIFATERFVLIFDPEVCSFFKNGK